MHAPLFRLIPVCLLLVFISGCNPAGIRTIIYNDPNINDYKIMPTRAVKAGKAFHIQHSEVYNKQPLTDSLQTALHKSKTVAFLVMKHDSIVYEWYRKGYSDSSHTNPFSATKAIVGVLTGIALKEGKIKSLDEPVCNYLPEYKEQGREKLTFRHLLTMSSGLDYHDNYFNPFGQTAKLYYGNDMQGLINSLKQEKEPGTEWRYKNCDPQILTMALQQAVGMNMSDYCSQKLWQPLGAEHDGWWTVDKKKDGVEKSYCCLYSNARDLAKVGMLYEHSGNWNGLQIVDSAYVKEATTPVQLDNGETHKGKQNHYGYLWWLRYGDGKKEFSMEGLRGQYIIVLPQEDLIIVRLGKWEWMKPRLRFKPPILFPTIIREVKKVWGKKKV